MGKEKWKIPKCPLCNLPHVYVIYLERTISMISGRPDVIETLYGRPAEDITSMTKEWIKHYKERFYCPITARHFDYTFDMKETRMASVTSLKVGEPVEGGDTPKVLEIIKRETIQQIPVSSNTYVDYFGENIPQSEADVLKELSKILQSVEATPFNLTGDPRLRKGRAIPVLPKMKIDYIQAEGHRLNDKRGIIVRGNHVRKLYIWDQICRNLPSNIHYLTQIELILIQNAGLRTIPNSIGYLKNLKELNLSNNQITSLTETIGNLDRLESLGLAINSLTQLPSTIGNLHSIKSISLSNNELRTLPESMQKLSSLESISLSHNEFTTIPRIILLLPNLKHLAIGKQQSRFEKQTKKPKWGNYISIIPEEITNLTRLLTLDLSGQEIDTVPDFIGKLSQLTKLDLSDNNISSLPTSITKLTQLVELNLMGNPLTEPSEQIHNWLGNLEEKGCLIEVSFKLKIETVRLGSRDVSINSRKIYFNSDAEVDLSELKKFRYLKSFHSLPLNIIPYI